MLILLGQGALTIEFPRHRLPLPAGHAAFIPAGTAFALQAGHDIKGRVLLITPGFGCGSPMPLPPGFRSGAVAAEDLPPIEPVILTPGTAQARPTTCGTDLTRQVALIARVLSRLDAPPCRSADTATCTVDSRLLTERFLELAQAELAEPQTIADMARKLGHSLARLDQACWQSRGRSALQLLYDLRLAQAAEALRRTTRPINEIALDLGYSGPGHFIRSFSAATGRSPQAYREFTRDGLQVAGSEAAQLQPETAPRCTDP
ncbi:helix-turn-helix transcriptional regulator [Paracoccus halophilus]|uniref:helix-turn-helix transcriptional regulator n=1 Tax=Paracoccus halophilus TaxID=376733 RepID=UPI001E4E16EC|nr:AraC family transcriptional regulator [Paracoccus halophilus]